MKKMLIYIYSMFLIIVLSCCNPLCLSIFWWAKFRKKKSGVKVHVLYDLDAQVSAYFHALQHLYMIQKR